MSALPSYTTDLGYHGALMTADEFLALGETPQRYQLIDGVVLMSPSPRTLHSRVLIEITAQLHAFEARGGVVDMYSETDLRVNDRSVYQPDLLAYARGYSHPPPLLLASPPDLIVEVLSPSTARQDLQTKRAAYERFGVREYWVVDADRASVQVWRHDGHAYTAAPCEGNTLASTAIPGFVLDLKPLRRLAGL